MRSIATLAPIDYLVIGHISQDLTPHGPQLGGTATYAALTAHALGLRVGVVTSWGEEIPLGQMQSVSLTNIPSQRSTTFENIYHHQGRIQKLHHKACNLHFDLVPTPWRDVPIVHLGPIAQEIELKVASQFPHSLVGVTPQGWMRSWDKHGEVHPKRWEEADVVLKNARVAIFSTEDVVEDEEYIEEIAPQISILVVTEGAQAARVYWHGDVRRFHPPSVEEVDPTGAGDIFAAAFLVQLHKTRDPWEATRFANYLAAQSVTRQGLMSIPTPEEIQNAIVEVF